MADSKKYNGSTWEHSLRKLTTATDTFTTLPVDVYADGNNATVGISGNTVQNGTPTPSNPVTVSGVGERTGNLFDYETMRGGKTNYYLDASGNEIENIGFWSITKYIPVDGTVFTLTRTLVGISPAICLYDSNKNFITGVSYQGEQVITISSNTNAAYIRFSYFIGEPLEDIAHDMLNTGSTAKPFEPYGYKIPISSANTTTPVYLGEVESKRRIKKLVLTGNESGAMMIDNTDHIFALRGIFNSEPELLQVGGVCTHYKYNNALSNLAANMQNGDFVLNKIVDDYSFALKDNSFNTPLDFLTYFQQQYAAGTPVTVWYVLSSTTTGIVNEPLMKIGDYADSISGITIPTITGKDTFDVLTTLKPSEVELTYTGWHDATVEEWDDSQWQ